MSFAYGGSSHMMGAESFGQEDDVLQRSVDLELDDMVQRNIRDVLQQVGTSHDGDGPYNVGAGAHRGLGGRAAPCSDESLYDDVVAAAAVAAPGPASTRAASQQQFQHPNPSKPVVRPRVGGSSAAGSSAAAATRTSAASAAGGGAGLGGRRTSGDPGPPPPLSASSAGGLPVGSATAGGAAGAGAAGMSCLDVPGQPEASLRLHKARLKAVEEELGRANRALLDREKQLTEALRDLKELRGQAANWAREKKALEGQADRARRQAADAETAARSTETQVRELTKADSRADRERKAVEAEVRARDVRLQRALEEVERYKQLLSEVRSQEREAKGSAAQDAGKLLTENRKLERQRGELVAAFKKQLKLIEVLKRQKVHLEAARALQFSEEEFMKTLEMGAA